jgi:hypothetical protein
MDYFALPALESDQPYDVGRTTNDLITHYVEYAKEKVLKDGSAGPIVILRAEKKACVIHCGPMMKDDATKDQLSIVLRQAAAAMEAVAYAFICEAWLAGVDKSLGKDYEAQRPSRRPDRIECLIVSGQYRGDKPRMRIVEMVRDAGGKLTHLLETDHCKDEEMTFEGRFAGLLDPEPEEDRWKKIMEGF